MSTRATKLSQLNLANSVSSNDILYIVQNVSNVETSKAVTVSTLTSIVNATSLAVGANVVANSSALFVGNSTVYAILTATSLVISNTTNTTVFSINGIAQS